MRSNFDFTPYRRSTVGFDRLFDLMESTMRVESGDNYPPFDIEKLSEDSYRITLAVAGFRPDEIEIVAQQNLLTVTGKKAEEANASERYVHRGIAARSFERRFQLADFVKVRSANFENGLLIIALQREVPEEMKPRKIEIRAGSAPEQIEAQPEGKREAAVIDNQ